MARLAPDWLVLDPPGWIRVDAGLALALITLVTGDDDLDIPGFSAIRLDQRLGIPPLLSSLAT